jgi:hypothetical protein
MSSVKQLVLRTAPRFGVSETALLLASFLCRHPREFRRLPYWLRERKLSPMGIRRPWWPYDATAWIAAHLPPDARVFEYGGGGSTLWLQDHGATVTVIEHQPEWARKLAAALAPGTRILQPAILASGTVTSGREAGYFDEYVATISAEPDASLDLVIVDGRARVDCVRSAIPKVKQGGLLLLDDTGVARYQPAFVLLADWERHVFAGLKPGYPGPAETSVWRRPTAPR